MRTQEHANKSPARATAFRPGLAEAFAKRASATPQRYRIIKKYEGFHLNQVVYQFTGPTYGVCLPDEVPVTVAPHKGPFVGLTADYLERVV